MMADRDKVHFHCLDGLRGAVAILIALRHTTDYFGPISFSQSYLAVDLFFLISGVAICHSYESRLKSGLPFKYFLCLRVIRLYPLFFLGAVIGIANQLLFSGGGVVSKMYHSLFILVCLPNPSPDEIYGGYFDFNGPAWSLFIEITGNLLYAYVIRFLSMTTTLAIMLTAIAGLIASVTFTGARSLDAGWTVATLWVGYCRFGFSFSAGVLIARLWQSDTFFLSRQDSQNISVSAFALILVAISCMILTWQPSRSQIPVFDLVAVILLFPLLVGLLTPLIPSQRVIELFSVVGSLSYPIYALHAPLGQLMENLFRILSHHNVMDYAPISGFVFMGFLLLICTILIQAYDLPVRNKLRSLLDANVTKKT